MNSQGGPGLRRAAARLRDARARVGLRGPETPRGKAAMLGGLIALTGFVLLLSLATGDRVAPPLMLSVPVMLGGLFLERRPLQALLLAVSIAYVIEVVDVGWDRSRPGAAVALVILGAIAVELARDRERLGLSAGRGEAMLMELRDQLNRQGELPPLPAGWGYDLALRSAGGSAFGGDFVVSTLTHGGDRLELALVDVSGKGLDAGTRALLLSGALGGLLGAVPPEGFLDAANDYVLRQDWDEGFATAVHVTLDLASGRYRVTSAGHPPIVHYSGGSGRWTVLHQDGMILGLAPHPKLDKIEGELARSDALLLYTDGLVEVPGRDLDVGIDRLLGAAERLIPHGFHGGANRLLDTVQAAGTDDRAVLLLWRT